MKHLPLTVLLGIIETDLPALTQLVEHRVKELEDCGEDLTDTKNGWSDEYQSLKRILKECQKNG